MTVKICDSRLKTATVYGSESYQCYVMKRWNGSIDIDTMDGSINISDSDVDEFIKALRALSKLDYKD